MLFPVFLNDSGSLLGMLRFLCHDLWNIPGVACLFFTIYFFSSLLSLPWPSEPLPQIELPLELLRGCFGKLLNWIQDNNASDHKEYLVYCLSNWSLFFSNSILIFQVWFFLPVLKTNTLNKGNKNYIERKSPINNLFMFVSKLKLKLLCLDNLGLVVQEDSLRNSEKWKESYKHVVQFLKWAVYT